MRVQLVVEKLFILEEHLSSPLVFSGVRVTQSLVFGVYTLTTIVCLYYFGHGILLRLNASDGL
jgi:ABC-type proline/glycine betaine transport system permease subunit